MHHEWEEQNGCNTVFPMDICLRNISINTLHKGGDDDDDISGFKFLNIMILLSVEL
jgi:hypothetical protein